HVQRQRRRLGHQRPIGRSQNSAPDGRARNFRGRYPGRHLRQRPSRVQSERSDASGGLARSRAHRSARALWRQLGLTRRTRAGHRGATSPKRGHHHQMSPRIRAYFELARPANVVTAFADILAGFAACGALARLLSDFPLTAGTDRPGAMLAWLLAATAGLYAGGVVLNDVFDAELDAVERPERPIPSGRVERRHAAALGVILLLAGVAAAAMVGTLSFLIALVVALSAVLYDAAGKHHALLGPINMGICRGGNLLLGISAVPAMVGELWFLAGIPVAYIGAVTAISTGEVAGGTRMTGILAILLVGTVTTALLLLGIRLDFHLRQAAPFLA